MAPTLGPRENPTKLFIANNAGRFNTAFLACYGWAGNYIWLAQETRVFRARWGPPIFEHGEADLKSKHPFAEYSWTFGDQESTAFDASHRDCNDFIRFFRHFSSSATCTKLVHYSRVIDQLSWGSQNVRKVVAFWDSASRKYLSQEPKIFLNQILGSMIYQRTCDSSQILLDCMK